MNTANHIDGIIKDLMVQQEQLLLDQLGDLVSKGLLICERGPISMYEDVTRPYSYKVSQQVKFVLKDKEYITKLEQENKELKEHLRLILHISDSLKK